MKQTKSAAAAEHAVDILKKDHDKVKALLKRFEGTDDGHKKRALAQEIFTEVEVHAKLEEELFYPALRRRSDTEEFTQLLHESIEEHHVASVLVHELKAMATTDERYDAKFKVLREAVEHHADEQEEQTFPTGRRVLGEEGMELGAKMMERKQELMPPEHRTKAA